MSEREMPFSSAAMPPKPWRFYVYYIAALVLPIIGFAELTPAFVALAVFSLPWYHKLGVLLLCGAATFFAQGISVYSAVYAACILAIGMVLLLLMAKTRLPYRTVCAITVALFAAFAFGGYLYGALSTGKAFFEAEAELAAELTNQYTQQTGLSLTYADIYKFRFALPVINAMFYGFAAVAVFCSGDRNNEKRARAVPMSPVINWKLPDAYTQFLIAVSVALVALLIWHPESALAYALVLITVALFPLCAQGAGALIFGSVTGCLGRFMWLVWAGIVLLFPLSLVFLPIAGLIEQFARSRDKHQPEGDE